MTNNGVLFSEISSLVPEIFTNSFSTKINHKIKNTSGNIGVMLLKFGISKVLADFRILQNGTL